MRRNLETVWSALPEALRHVLRPPLKLAIELSCFLHPLYLISAIRIGRYKNKHRGQRCFIIGNGPSLKKTDLSRLRGEITFGLNRIYLAFDDMGFRTTYLVTVNELVMQQFGKDIAALPIPKFLYWPGRRYCRFDRHSMFLRLGSPHTHFATDIRRPLGPGSTVTYAAMQIAYFMGFTKVVLVGIDHSFESKGQPNAEVISEEDDPNHFDPRYFGKGVKWQLPDLERSEAAYRVAKERFEADDREIVDATIGGKLDVFREVPYDDLF